MEIKVEIDGDSDEAIALALLQMIIRVEGKEEEGADRRWILSTYRQCLAAVQGEDWEADEDDEDEDEEDEDELPPPPPPSRGGP